MMLSLLVFPVVVTPLSTDILYSSNSVLHYLSEEQEETICLNRWEL